MVTVPVILFAYARPDLLKRVLDCLRRDRVPIIHAFSDAARSPRDEEAVGLVRATLRSVDWCEIHVVERTQNFGLGRNILSGVSQIAVLYDAFVVWEDDLICVQGTYPWLCAALEKFRDEGRVGSVTGWTNEKVIPEGVMAPYFDGRAECWVWGSWPRAWEGMMDETAIQKMHAAESLGIVRDRYGSDLPAMAAEEQRKNIWAVRWLYHHLQHGYLCLRPPAPMVEHVGAGTEATNASAENEWDGPLGVAASSECLEHWPVIQEHPSCAELWRAAVSRRSIFERVVSRVCRVLKSR